MEIEPTQAGTLGSQSAPLETGSTNSESRVTWKPLRQMIEESFLDGKDLNKKLLEIEAAILIVALNRTEWNKRQAADLLGLNRTTLVEKCKRHGLMNPVHNLTNQEQ